MISGGCRSIQSFWSERKKGFINISLFTKDRSFDMLFRSARMPCARLFRRAVSSPALCHNVIGNRASGKNADIFISHLFVYVSRFNFLSCIVTFCSVSIFVSFDISSWWYGPVPRQYLRNFVRKNVAVHHCQQFLLCTFQRCELMRHMAFKPLKNSILVDKKCTR